jgi:hypothetical protein
MTSCGTSPEPPPASLAPVDNPLDDRLPTDKEMDELQAKLEADELDIEDRTMRDDVLVLDQEMKEHYQELGYYQFLVWRVAEAKAIAQEGKDQPAEEEKEEEHQSPSSTPPQKKNKRSKGKKKAK